MITVLARLKIREGCEAAFLDGCRKLAAVAATEQQTLLYEYHIDAQSRTALVLERYPDSRSMEFHMANTADLAAEGAGNYDVEHLDICGPVSAATRQMFISHYGGQASVGLIFYDSTIAK